MELKKDYKKIDLHNHPVTLGFHQAMSAMATGVFQDLSTETV